MTDETKPELSAEEKTEKEKQEALERYKKCFRPYLKRRLDSGATLDEINPVNIVIPEFEKIIHNSICFFTR